MNFTAYVRPSLNSMLKFVGGTYLFLFLDDIKTKNKINK